MCSPVMSDGGGSGCFLVFMKPCMIHSTSIPVSIAWKGYFTIFSIFSSNCMIKGWIMFFLWIKFINSYCIYHKADRSQSGTMKNTITSKTTPLTFCFRVLNTGIVPDNKVARLNHLALPSSFWPTYHVPL